MSITSASPARADATSLADPIIGTEEADTITTTLPVGGPNTTPGADTVFALGGHDTVEGGEGADWLDGGDGDDRLRVNGTDDTLIGGNGNDDLAVLLFSAARSQLLGGDGDDRLNAYASRNGAGNLLDGGDGNDFIDYGSDAFNDTSTLIGGAGDDTLRVMASDVTIDAGSGDDVIDFYYDGDLYPTHGDITLGEGRDQLNLSQSTGAGYDLELVPRVLDFAAGAGGDVLNVANVLVGGFGTTADDNPFVSGRLVWTFEGGETILRSSEGAEMRFVGLDPATLTAANIAGGYDPNGDFVARELTGTAGADRLIGADGDDRLAGGRGNDLLDGLLGGQDQLSGDAGQDTLLGFSEADLLAGGAGRDVIFGGGGDDTIYGGDGDDREAFNLVVHDVLLSGSGLVGGEGNDALYGGGGQDNLVGGLGRDTLVGGRGNDTLTGDVLNSFVPGPRDTDLNDLYVFAGGLTDGVDVITRFNVDDADALALQGWFGPAGGTLVDGDPLGGDDFDPLAGPVDVIGGAVLALDLPLGRAPAVGDVVDSLATSTFADGVRVAVLVHDRRGGAEGSFSLFFAQESATDGNRTLDAGEIRLAATATLAETRTDLNAFADLSSRHFWLNPVDGGTQDDPAITALAASVQAGGPPAALHSDAMMY